MRKGDILQVAAAENKSNGNLAQVQQEFNLVSLIAIAATQNSVVVYPPQLY
jgi:hypothetical protein